MSAIDDLIRYYEQNIPGAKLSFEDWYNPEENIIEKVLYVISFDESKISRREVGTILDDAPDELLSNVLDDYPLLAIIIEIRS